MTRVRVSQDAASIAVGGASVARALREAGCNPVVGVEFEPKSLANELGIIPLHRRLFGRFLEILAEDHVLELADNRGRWLRALPARWCAGTPTINTSPEADC